MSIFLKVKIKSLAAEARFIRREERRQGRSYRFLKKRDAEDRTNDPSIGQLSSWAFRHRLHHLRVVDVRQEARSAQLAYGFLRGRPLDKMESEKTNEAPQWDSVFRLVDKYYEGGHGGADLHRALRSWIWNSNFPRVLRTGMAC